MKREEKEKRFRGRLLRYAKETVGNRASRNADADKGNPYDRFWCAGYLRSVSVYSDGTTGEDVFTPVREISKFFEPSIVATSIERINEIT